MADEVKFPWESKTELAAFIGLFAVLLTSFGVYELTPEQIEAISGILFVAIAIMRIYGGGALVLKKS